MTLNNDDVLRLAQLSKLRLNKDEQAQMLVELNAIIGYVEKLQQVDISGFDPTAQVTGLTNVFRDDKIEDLHVSKEELLKNAPMQQDGYIKVRRVL